MNYICHAEAKHFQPANITFDLLLPLDEATRRRIRDKKQRHAMVCERALTELQGWLKACGEFSPALRVEIARLDRVWNSRFDF